MSDLYNRIHSLCAVRGTNITKMCADTGVARSSLTDLKKGRSQGLSSQTLALIANYFDVSVDYLIGNEKAPADSEGMAEYLQLLRDRPETRMLLQYSKGVGKKEIEAMAEMMKKLRGDDA